MGVKRSIEDLLPKGGMVGLVPIALNPGNLPDEGQLAAAPAQLNLALIELYKLGDRTGLPWESKSMHCEPDGYLPPSPLGSDESSIVDCFLAFTASYRFSTTTQFLWDWCQYHTEHHGTGYGRTYKEHFADMKSLRRNYTAEEGVAHLYRISKERNSFGNGCLALVLPAYFYARKQGLPPQRFIEEITTLNYFHPEAVGACERLYQIVSRADNGCHDYPPYTEPLAVIKAPDTLNAALYCGDEDTEEAVIRKAIYLGGHVDSVLSLALLLHGLLKRKEPLWVKGCKQAT
jgi:ADP-ribosylglycohydrolase